MSPPHRYHQPNAPDSPSEDSGSDLELDLQELDPTTSSAHPSKSNRPLGHDRYGSREGAAARQLRAGQIAMRSLRTAGSRRFPNRPNDEGGFTAQDSGGPDAPARHHQTNSRSSDTSSHTAADEEPLLRSSSPPPDGPQRRLSGERTSRPSSRWWLPHTIERLVRSRQFTDASSLKMAGAEEGEQMSTRIVQVGRKQRSRYPPNAVSNAKYTPWSFLPLTLYNEFSFFFNMYFLLVALSQILPALRIGYLSTYIVPLAFVLAITLGKEASDDIARRRRDAEANSEGYTVLQFTESVTKLGQSNTQRSAVSQQVPGSRQNGRGHPSRPTDGHDSPSTSMTVHEVVKKSRDLKVGDVLKLGKDQRVPADVVILKSYSHESDSGAVTLTGQSCSNVEHATPLDTALIGDVSPSPASPTNLDPIGTVNAGSLGDVGDLGGEAFIRTDQLDGETDWKLRQASPLTQALSQVDFTNLRIHAGKPERKVNEFVGTIEYMPEGVDDGLRLGNGSKQVPEIRNSRNGDTENPSKRSSPLNIDNTAWANTVLASSSITLAVIVYTGPQTRQALSTSPSRSKTGLLEYEINSLTKVLCVLTLSLSIVLVALEGFESTVERKWYVAIMRFLVLFSTIIPISLRVNLDMGKTVYAWFIERDQGIKGTVVRTSTIPEELGRVEYLLSDKTGTLTQNEMELRKIHVGTVSYANEAMDEVTSYVHQAFSPATPNSKPTSLVTPSSGLVGPSNATSATRTRREIGSRVRHVVLALALCHNVTPNVEDDHGKSVTTYQASSPDEIAIVRWTESVGLRLMHRDRKGMVLQSTRSGHIVVRVRILEVFPFTSEGKRMGVIVQFYESIDSKDSDNQEAGEIWFFQKGADTVMASIVAANDWLDEETANMAREGLRTLVVGRKKLSLQQYRDFSSNFKEASLALQGRDLGMARVVQEHLERDLELLGVTGVEDKLQRDVKPSLELLRNAGIKIWMLTGDKIETARCVAVSAKLVSRGQYVHTVARLKRKDLAQDSLEFLQSKPDACLLIDGESLALLLTHFRERFISLAVLLPAVIACRCSPTQKADIAKLIREYTKKRICCIGDGGNDVSMIQAADVGVGIVGKEGRQASLAADFSIEQFCHLTKLLVWHGRNSYKRSAKLAQFIIHRGLIISVCQTMFSIASKFEPIALYKDWLLVGYATVYTSAPVFSLVLDKDVDENLANLYPELYKELTTGRSLSYRTFFVWVLVSIYQGSIIQGLSQILVEVDSARMVSVSFTVLVINELIMVAFEVTTWHPVMIFSLVGTALFYFGSIPFLGRYFDLEFVATLQFVWRVAAISAISLIPPYVAKIVRRTWKPPSYRKVQGL